MRTIGKEGQKELARIDKTLYFSKQFVELWRSAKPPEKIQFIDFLAKKAPLPERFMVVYKPLDHLHRAFGGGFIDRCIMLSESYQTKTVDDLCAV